MKRKKSQTVCESLELRQLLSIVWANEFTDTTFNAEFGSAAPVARAIVERAIADWNAAVPNLYYVNPIHDALQINITAADLGPGYFGVTSVDKFERATGKPTAASITLDNDGGGGQWYFDTTPKSDSEFVDQFSPYAMRAPDHIGRDLYRTIAHEIGHALGIGSFDNLAISQDLFSTGYTAPDGSDLMELRVGGSVLAMMTSSGGGHVYEEPIAGRADLPAYPYDLMNAGYVIPWDYPEEPNPKPDSPTRVFPGSPSPAVRELISPIDLQILSSVYGYTVVMPPTISGGIVTVEGTAGADALNVSAADGLLTVLRNGLPVAHFKQSGVSGLVINGRAGADTVIIDASVDTPATVMGGSGNDYLAAGSGPSMIYGGSGADTLFGGSGDCGLFGGAGNDKLWAGTGAAQLAGGTGSDTFHLRANSNMADDVLGVDRVRHVLS